MSLLSGRDHRRCVGLELARQGRKVLNIDKLSGAGFGSTSGSCAIIRLHYSTPDGVAMAREGYYYWLDWARYLGVQDPTGMVKYINTGCLVMKTEKNHFLKNVMSALDELHVCYEELMPEEIRQRFPMVDTRQYGPPTLPSDERFGHPTGDQVAGALYILNPGSSVIPSSRFTMSRRRPNIWASPTGSMPK